MSRVPIMSTITQGPGVPFTEEMMHKYVLTGQGESDAHSCTDWASIASAARRYSPASQSLARCR